MKIQVERIRRICTKYTPRTKTYRKKILYKYFNKNIKGETNVLYAMKLSLPLKLT